jgi:uncharacterized protein YndB with AHSA1/START domain
MKFLLTTVTAACGLLALVWGIGTLVPRDHVASRSARYAKKPEQVWRLLSDLPHYARWAPEVTAVRRLPDHVGHPVYALEGKWAMPLEIETAEPPHRMVTRIADPTLPFGGTWTWVVARDGRGTRVTVTEHGEIRPAIMRAMTRFFFGYTSTMDQYLEALGRELDESVTPEPARAAI